MAHIKKIVMQGFKSFARRTEIPFDQGINVVIGPNGSGKSNVSDAICFALGRLSAKSMRAEKSKSLIFMGSKYIKPAKEAYVELVFDNSDRVFAIDNDEIKLSRAVRNTGVSVYKINGETKTRGEIIETLAQAGIDPYGFNLILQGQIQSIVKMHGEERRKIIEEVAGISVYEWRKEKSLKELEKTDDRLKEISAVLRERGAFLNNLEKEKSQAEKYQELKDFERKAKGSILKKKIDDKNKEVESIIKAIEEKTIIREKKNEKIIKIQSEIDELQDKINQTNKHIRETSGIEQGKLREEITNLKANLEGLKVRKEGYGNRKVEFEKRIFEMSKNIPEIDSEIKILREKSPSMAKKVEELKKKKDELNELEKERKLVLSIRAELNSIRERIDDKRKEKNRIDIESEELLKQIEVILKEFHFKNELECNENFTILKESLHKVQKNINDLLDEELINEKLISVCQAEINYNKEIKNKVEDIDLCPMCQSKITIDHISHVFQNCDEKILSAEKKLDESLKILKNLSINKIELRKNILELEIKIKGNERESISHRVEREKHITLKKIVDRSKSLYDETVLLENRRKNLEGKTDDLSKIEERYSNKILEIEEISSRTEIDIDTTLLYKERELEKIRNVIESSKIDLKTIENQIIVITQDLKKNYESLLIKENQEEKLNEKFNKMFLDRDKNQIHIQELSIKLTEMQSEIRQIEDQSNYLRIGKAKIEGEKEAFEIDFKEYLEIEIISGSIQNIEDRLKKTQETLLTIGSINMRALEVYDKIKAEYDQVKTKVEILDNEKLEILRIIEEIDKKKDKTFIKTFKAINALFTTNFSKLSSKGIAYLEIENKDKIFEGGIDIVIRIAKGKYFDVTSLSGGEQTLVALSLLFAIQKHKPYQFYIFDEIDAALDKRNSEKLSSLLTQYMKTGQYIVVTHNDAVILNSQVLYGVSMHEGVSKILSLHIGDEEAIKEVIKNKVDEPGNEIKLDENMRVMSNEDTELKDMFDQDLKTKNIEEEINNLNNPVLLNENEIKDND